MSENSTTNDLDILEELKILLYDAIKNNNKNENNEKNEKQVKVGDLLKVIELKNKLSVAGKGEKKFWEMIDKIRDKELNSQKSPWKGKSTPRRGKSGKKES